MEISYPGLFNTIFQIVDTWTVTVSKQEYVSFARNISARITFIIVEYVSGRKVNIPAGSLHQRVVDTVGGIPMSVGDHFKQIKNTYLKGDNSIQTMQEFCNGDAGSIEMAKTAFIKTRFAGL
jgi:hypothetical protein